MHVDGKKLLSLMFRPGDTVCVSPNKFGYHSIPLETILNAENVILVPTQDSVNKRNEARKHNGLTPLTWEECFETCDTNTLLLVALNPINGWRQDANCYKYRNFLIEMDYGTTEEQLSYIKRLGMPYSAAIFSGGKSVHMLISLAEDLPSEQVYRLMAEWTLNIATLTDENCKNPSRSIRIPGAERDPGKFQQLLEWNGPIKLSDYVAWLNSYPNARPKEQEERKISGEPIDLTKLKPWVAYALEKGLDATKGRNKQWFAIACEFALSGYSEDDTLSMLENYFTPDRTFGRKEWKTTVISGFKYIYANR